MDQRSTTDGNFASGHPIYHRLSRVRKIKRSTVVNRVRGPRRWFWIKRRISNRYMSNHRPPIHHRLRTKGPIPRFAGVLAPIGGNRTFDGSTSHLMCSPLGTSGNCTRIRKRAYNCENELTLEVVTKSATISVSAGGELGNTAVPHTKLFKQRGSVTEQFRSSLRIHERCGWVGLAGKNKHKSDHGEATVSDAQCFQSRELGSSALRNRRVEAVRSSGQAIRNYSCEERNQPIYLDHS